MRTLFRSQKPISLIVLVSLYWLCIPQLPAQGAMITTEDTLDGGSRVDFDRLRIKAFVSRQDVIARLQSYGISAEEALARVDSLTDEEIALIADKIDQLPVAGADFGTAIWAVAGNYILIGMAIFMLIIIAILYLTDEGPNKPTYREF